MAFLLASDDPDPSAPDPDGTAPMSLGGITLRTDNSQQLPTCLNVAERFHAIRNKTYSIDNTTTAAGVTRLEYCVGMYCELNDDDYFIWHAFGRPMDGDGEDADVPGSADHDKIAGVHAEWLKSKLGEATELMRSTLILSTVEHIEENVAMIDGILAWVGVEDREGWKVEKLKACHAFIVREPGVQGGIVEEYYEKIDRWHPEHWSRKWDVRSEGELDGIDGLVPSRFEVAA